MLWNKSKVKWEYKAGARINKDFLCDSYRMTGKKWGVKGFFLLLLRYDLRYLYLIRQRKTKLRTFFALRAARKYGL